MKLAIIGASGFVGSRVLTEALVRGHDVTAIVRDTSRLVSRDAVKSLAADIQDANQVAAAVEGQDAVLSCFHPGGHDSGANPHLYRDIVEGTHSIMIGCKRAGIKRILYVGGCGSLYVRPGTMLVDDPEALLAGTKGGRPDGTYPEVAAGQPSLDIPKAARTAYLLFERESELDWTFLSPSRFLGDYGGRSGSLRIGDDHLLYNEDGTPAKIDVADLAVAMLDELEDPHHIRGHFTVASARISGRSPS